ncbi:hypothetical protein POTOM_002800 [Populus tomentosa]|uniref:40S ribosomal protein S8 n=1 Tax=Populus tomentosa TaxID=118781 RepID=A0A8X8DK71_POPTO|nr:hypothetical protein POTOM_002800 [Populus tomentosa]
MGISRDSMHKRRATGGKKKAWRKKRKYELRRQPASTKLSSNKTVRRIRVRGGNVKWRALRLDTGNYSWGSEAVDAAPFKQWYLQHCGIDIGRKKKTTAAKKEGEHISKLDGFLLILSILKHYRRNCEAVIEEVNKSNHVLRKLEKRQQTRKLDPHIEEQFGSGRLLASISSCPGQCGRADGFLPLDNDIKETVPKGKNKRTDWVMKDNQ